MIERLIDAALGKRAADVVLKNGKFVNVFTGEVQKGDIAITDGKIVGVGSYEGDREYDIRGKVAVPGLIDAHVHIESAQLSPEEFARLVMPCGTTTVIADPHEITNVCGADGARYIARAARNTPLEVKLMLPSCVPATPFETSGAALTGADTAELLREDTFFGLAEFMNVPGVLGEDAEAMQKLEAARALRKIVDGHAPNAEGEALNAYIAAGISTDHECGCAEEAEEKVAKGMYVFLREGTAARNAAANSRAVTATNLRRFLFCTDDRHAGDIRAHGHIDNALRVAVQAGLNPVWAVIAATLNAAECYGLRGKGAIAPGYDADIAVLEDLQDFRCCFTFKKGELVAIEGMPLFGTGDRQLPDCVRNTVHIGDIPPEAFRLRLQGERANVIRILPGSVVTGRTVREVPSADGDVELRGTDLLKLAVVERHRGTGNIGLGLLEGCGLWGGAVATTVAHDSHNIIVLGDNNADMAAAVAELHRIGGGMAVVGRGRTASLALDIAGLMSSLPAEEYIERAHELREAAYDLGFSRAFDPFMALSFLALPVIPSLKLTDRGLFDVDKFAFCSVDAAEDAEPEAGEVCEDTEDGEPEAEEPAADLAEGEPAAGEVGADTAEDRSEGDASQQPPAGGPSAEDGGEGSF